MANLKYSVSTKDVSPIRDWAAAQAKRGAADVIFSDVDYIRSVESAQSFIDRLDTEDRTRLLRSLAVRRSRLKNKKALGYKSAQLEADAHEMLIALATQKKITTSELLRQVLEKEYLELVK